MSCNPDPPGSDSEVTLFFVSLGLGPCAEGKARGKRQSQGSEAEARGRGKRQRQGAEAEAKGRGKTEARG